MQPFAAARAGERTRHDMTKLLKLGRGAIKLGEPLPYPVYDQSGNLLLREGFRVNLQRTLDALISQGWHPPLPEAPPTGAPRRPSASPVATAAATEQVSTFALMELIKQRLQRAISLVREARADDFLTRIEGIALTLQEACTHDTDSALASLHLDYETAYSVLHPLQAAILCELVGKKLGVGDDARLTLVQAALSHDLALLDVQDDLDRQLAPLTDDQWAVVQAHPAETVALLRELGVSNAVWLNAVGQHHERLDGSGYPGGLRAEQLPAPTRILMIADIYSAMIRHRPYRKALVSTDAMRQLLVGQGEKTDPRLTQLMIKELGVFPPGALVRLASGEIAMVKERVANTASPVAYAFIRTDGMPMTVPVRRETARSEFQIQGLVPVDQYRGSASLLRRLWEAD